MQRLSLNAATDVYPNNGVVTEKRIVRMVQMKLHV